MTREVQLRVQHRALMRRSGIAITVDREEGRAMAAQLRAGDSIQAIAKIHGVSTKKVARRLFTMRALPVWTA